jgi:hypothetical protein
LFHIHHNIIVLGVSEITHRGLADAWLDASQGLKSVALYANRLQRAVEKNTAHLEALQAKRKAAHAQTQEEAMLLTQLAEANGETYNPAPDFPSTGAAGEFVYVRQESLADLVN